MLQAYNFSIVHKSGTKMGTADALSRLPLHNSNESVPVPTEWIHLLEVLDTLPVTASDISKCTMRDPVLSVVLKYIREGWPPKVTSDLQSYFNELEELSVQDGCVKWGNRGVILFNLHDKLSQDLHNELVGQHV